MPAALSPLTASTMSSGDRSLNVATTEFVASNADLRDLKSSCLAASTSNVSLSSPGSAMDGVTLTDPSRVFLKDQTAPAENGIYNWTGAAVALTRSLDANDASKLSDSCLVSVEQGTVNYDTMWELISNNPLVLGTTALYFTRIWPNYSIGAFRDPWSVSGNIYENIQRNTAFASQTLTSGTLRLCGGITLRAGVPVSTIKFYAAAAASSPTNTWACIVRQDTRAIVAVSASKGAAAIPAGEISFAITSPTPPYIPASDLPVWVGLMEAATTPATIAGAGHVGGIQDRAPIISGNSNTGQTVPLAIGTIVTAPTSGTQNLMAGLA